MFFEIKKSSDPAYPNVLNLTNQLSLNCDAGWSTYKVNGATVHYKGYNDSALTDDEFAGFLITNPTPSVTGNFIAIIVDDSNNITITNDLYRGSPIRYRTGENFVVTNLPVDGENVWADRIITITPDLGIAATMFDPHTAVDDFSPLSDSEVITKIDDLLNESFETFLTKNTLPIKIFLSGGIDTLTCFTYLKKFTNNFEIVAGECMDFTKFICAKKHVLRTLWGYTQIHHFRDPCVLVTGGNGDEEFMRSPTTSNMVLKGMNSSVNQELTKAPDCYHHHYFMLDKHQQIFKQQEDDADLVALVSNRNALYRQVLNVLINDHQHWHLENTLTFTPLKNLKFTNYLLRGSKVMLASQITDSAVSKALIAKYDPELLTSLCTQKNLASQENMFWLYEKYQNHIHR